MSTSQVEFQKKLLQATLGGKTTEMNNAEKEWTLKIKPLINDIEGAIQINSDRIQTIWRNIEELEINDKLKFSYQNRVYVVEKRGYLPRIPKRIQFTGKSLFYLPDEKEPNRKIWLKAYQVKQCCLNKMPEVTSGCAPGGLGGSEYCARKLQQIQKPLKNENKTKNF